MEQLILYILPLLTCLGLLIYCNIFIRIEERDEESLEYILSRPFNNFINLLLFFGSFIPGLNFGVIAYYYIFISNSYSTCKYKHKKNWFTKR